MKYANKALTGLVVATVFTTTVWAACSSTLDMGGHKIMGLPTPVASSDIATKAYVDSVGKVSTGSMQDHEGYTHRTITINGQTWMAENMYVTTYPTGAHINSSTGDWSVDNGRFSFAYDMISGEGGNETSKHSIYTEKFGNLYQWSAAMNGITTEGAQGICPTGWHIPTKTELETLKANVSVQTAEKLIGLGNQGNGFNFPLNGHVGLNVNGWAYHRNFASSIISSTEESPGNAYKFTLWKDGNNVIGPGAKNEGSSVRCLKN